MKLRHYQQHTVKPAKISCIGGHYHLRMQVCAAMRIQHTFGLPGSAAGITHGTGPQSNWDFLIISATAIIVIATLFFSIKWLLMPGEKSDTHIKHLILNID